MPLDELKIDISFVRNLVSDNDDKAIVLAIITMANSLGLDVIAEGVETEEQKQELLKNGCSNFLGFLFGRPIRVEEAVSGLDARAGHPRCSGEDD